MVFRVWAQSLRLVTVVGCLLVVGALDGTDGTGGSDGTDGTAAHTVTGRPAVRIAVVVLIVAIEVLTFLLIRSSIGSGSGLLLRRALRHDGWLRYTAGTLLVSTGLLVAAAVAGMPAAQPLAIVAALCNVVFFLANRFVRGRGRQKAA